MHDFSGKKMAKLFYYLIENHGRKKTLEFLNLVCPFYAIPTIPIALEPYTN
jgi:hypothetical protein